MTVDEIYKSKDKVLDSKYKAVVYDEEGCYVTLIKIKEGMTIGQLLSELWKWLKATETYHNIVIYKTKGRKPVRLRTDEYLIEVKDKYLKKYDYIEYPPGCISWDLYEAPEVLLEHLFIQYTNEHLVPFEFEIEDSKD